MKSWNQDLLLEKNRKFIKTSVPLGGEAETAAWRSSSGEKGVKTKARLLSIIDDMRKVKALAAIHMAVEIMGRYLNPGQVQRQPY